MKKWVVTSLSINRELSHNQYSLNGASTSVSSHQTCQLSVEIEILDTSNIPSTLEGFEDFISGNQHEWASQAMIDEALREKYPERFL